MGGWIPDPGSGAPDLRTAGRPGGRLTGTLVHGFPTSSHDWAAVLPALVAAGFRITTLDLLGFGASDKPRPHAYTLMEQADIVEAVWAALGTTTTALVAHDYGVSVAQELLARDASRVTRVAWLNGGLYPDLHRPTRNQRLLHGRLGPLLVRLVDEQRYTRSLRVVLARPLPPGVMHELWLATSERDGARIGPALLRYIDERRVHAERWRTALEGFPGPSLFVWGPDDPVSGAHVLPRLRERLPQATFAELPGVGHYPQLEAPDEVGPLLGRWLTTA